MTSAVPPLADTALPYEPSFCETITTQSLKGVDKKTHFLQHVLRDTNRLSIVKWTIDDDEEHGEKGADTKALQQFPEWFCLDYNASITRVSCYWKDHYNIINRYQPDMRTNQTSSQLATWAGIKNHFIKAQYEGDRKRSQWKKPFIYWLSEIERLRKVEVCFDSRLLHQMATEIVTTSTNENCNINTNDHRSSLPVTEYIKSAWVSRFIQCDNTVGRTQTSKFLLFSAKL